MTLHTVGPASMAEDEHRIGPRAGFGLAQSMAQHSCSRPAPRRLDGKPAAMGGGGTGGVTALQPHPGPEKPEKDEKPTGPDAGTPFSGFPTFSGLGTAQNAPATDATAALAAVRAYRQPPLPKPPRAPRRAPQAARAGFGAPGQAPVATPGVPLDWCEGVALLAPRTAPPTIPPWRWAMLATTSARMLHDRGVALHGAGWDALDLFGLDATAPATNLVGWGRRGCWRSVGACWTWRRAWWA